MQASAHRRLRAPLCLLVALACAAPLAGASSPPAASASDGRVCETTLVPMAHCLLYARTNLTLIGCGDASCVLRVESLATASASMFGLHRVETTLFSEVPVQGLCVADVELPGPYCSEVCHQVRPGLHAKCWDVDVVTVPLAAGDCASLVFASVFEYDVSVAFSAVALGFELCRGDDGAGSVAAS